MSRHPVVAVALDGAGWHPGAWREATARPGELFSAGYWVDLVQEAEHGLLDLVTLEDGAGLQSDRPGEPDQRTDRVRGRLDAVQVAARVAPLTRHVGLLPTVVVTHSEPFHAAKAIATLDHVSSGRAGVRVQVSLRPHEARHFGRRTFPAWGSGTEALVEEAFAEVADFVEVLRRLWDSWEDDAEIRDVATGRFVDRDKLHHVDFEGRWFSVRGPSITPRPPQGQPLVAALAHQGDGPALVGRSADLGFVTPSGVHDVPELVAAVDRGRREAGRSEKTVHVLGDLVVFLGDTEAQAVARRDRLDEQAGEAFTSDAHVFTGTPGQLADLVLSWHEAGLSGVRLRPGALPDDLRSITRGLVPELQRRGAFRTAYDVTSPPGLRGLLGLPRPENRYATHAEETA